MFNFKLTDHKENRCTKTIPWCLVTENIYWTNHILPGCDDVCIFQRNINSSIIQIKINAIAPHICTAHSKLYTFFFQLHHYNQIKTIFITHHKHIPPTFVIHITAPVYLSSNATHIKINNEINLKKKYNLQTIFWDGWVDI